MCNWVHLPDRQNSTERRCPEEGEPYCEDHAKLMEKTFEELTGRVATSTSAP